MAWVVACASGEVQQGALKRLRLDNGDPIVLTRLANQQAVAFHNECPHFKGPLGSGRLHGDSIVCPWHFFRFDLATGAAAGTDASIMKLKLYPVREADGGVLVEI